MGSGVDIVVLGVDISVLVLNTLCLERRYKRLDLECTCLERRYKRLGLKCTFLERRYKRLGLKCTCLERRYKRRGLKCTCLERRYTLLGQLGVRTRSSMAVSGTRGHRGEGGGVKTRGD